jgi:hypothetical protein
MGQPHSPAGGEPLLTTGGIFVIHLRSDTDLGRGQICGRIEHVMSGQSEPFVCLADMLDFMERYTGALNQQGAGKAEASRSGAAAVCRRTNPGAKVRG